MILKYKWIIKRLFLEAVWYTNVWFKELTIRGKVYGQFELSARQMALRALFARWMLVSA